MDTQSEFTSSKEIITYLSHQFPNCFTTQGDAKPLKIGIFQDIVERYSDKEQFSKTKLRLALRVYTASWRYLYCIKEGAQRVDLDGNLCEAITAEQAGHALAQLKESKDKVKAKKVAENKDNPLKKTHSAKVKNTSVPPKTKPVNNEKTPKKVILEQLKVGDAVKVILGSKPVPAVISAIEKEQIKVKVTSGMELTVSAAHILI